MTNGHMSLDHLPAALRDRAGKVGNSDPNTAEYLRQAAAGLRTLRTRLRATQAEARALRRELEALEDPSAPVRDQRTPRVDAEPVSEDPGAWWDQDGPTDDELDEMEF